MLYKALFSVCQKYTVWLIFDWTKRFNKARFIQAYKNISEIRKHRTPDYSSKS